MHRNAWQCKQPDARVHGTCLDQNARLIVRESRKPLRFVGRDGGPPLDELGHYSTSGLVGRGTTVYGGGVGSVPS